MRILILCTGNSCRSQMAHGFLQALDGTIEVHSAGTSPATCIHPTAIAVMKEVGIDISCRTPQGIGRFLDEAWDYVVTVCGNANESCPTFTGTVRHRLHIGFDDPAKATGDASHVLAEFRRIRDEIREKFHGLYRQATDTR